MIPLTGHVNELNQIQPRLMEIAKAVMAEKKVNVGLQIRHDDRDSARRSNCRRDCRSG